MSLVVVNDLVWTRQLTAEDHSIPGGSKTDEPAKQCGNRANHVGELSEIALDTLEDLTKRYSLRIASGDLLYLGPT